MVDNSYHHQRIEGSHLIIEKVKEIALKSNIVLNKIEWNRGNPIAERDFHILEIVAGRKSIKERFSDESLADFPGKAGTENTIKKIRKMIQFLKNRKSS